MITFLPLLYFFNEGIRNILGAKDLPKGVI